MCFFHGDYRFRFKNSAVLSGEIFSRDFKKNRFYRKRFTFAAVKTGQVRQKSGDIRVSECLNNKKAQKRKHLTVVAGYISGSAGQAVYIIMT
jgi:hypothetical protein